ncbi:hypothetical protein BDZ97DRAFT_1920516 [Flammula alnicola]|nr:hypothetical protein BDZ97DRAFT_1920516 [Flammula alnicola]
MRMQKGGAYRSSASASSSTSRSSAIENLMRSQQRVPHNPIRALPASTLHMNSRKLGHQAFRNQGNPEMVHVRVVQHKLSEGSITHASSISPEEHPSSSCKIMVSRTWKNCSNSSIAKICGEYREVITEGSTPGGVHVDIDDNEEEAGTPDKPELINLVIAV